ncbi:hypothetical protein SH661x_002993 [Planctomicrobium sp. SH661]|uniref:hypothetical protein n=1 Tax=Planctomicrobium sp. SH661 TaxID=3448124 RepID=UPI003F5B2E49
MFVLLAAGFCVLGELGCGSNAARKDAAIVHGQISLDGVPVDSGIVSLIPQPGVVSPAGGSAIKNGSFEILREQQLAPGEYRVEVTVTPKFDQPPSGGLMAKPSSKEKVATSKSFKKPTQTIILKSGENDYQIDLKSDVK